MNCGHGAKPLEHGSTVHLRGQGRLICRLLWKRTWIPNVKHFNGQGMNCRRVSMITRKPRDGFGKRLYEATMILWHLPLVMFGVSYIIFYFGSLFQLLVSLMIQALLCHQHFEVSDLYPLSLDNMLARRTRWRHLWIKARRLWKGTRGSWTKWRCSVPWVARGSCARVFDTDRSGTLRTTLRGQHLSCHMFVVFNQHLHGYHMAPCRCQIATEMLCKLVWNGGLIDWSKSFFPGFPSRPVDWGHSVPGSYPPPN